MGVRVRGLGRIVINLGARDWVGSEGYSCVKAPRVLDAGCVMLFSTETLGVEFVLWVDIFLDDEGGGNFSRPAYSLATWIVCGRDGWLTQGSAMLDGSLFPCRRSPLRVGWKSMSASLGVMG